MRLIVATRNSSKLKEIRQILKGIKMPIVSLVDLDKKFRLIENGKTFQANAYKKALPVSKVYKSDYVLGEDSGIEVDCLKGAPGIYSKRYSGPRATYLTNNRKLLKALEDVSQNKRRACFRCCLALAWSGRKVRIFEGRLKGVIAKQAKGKNGFGYDPVMYLPKYKKTVAQLSLKEKNKISHRAQAFNKLKQYLYRERV
jgi:XTP/dITP diphosphohydrolase